MKKMIFFMAAGTVWTQQVWAWGGLAHRATALIAHSELEPKVEAAVMRLLQSETRLDEQGQPVKIETMADVANWADGARNRPEFKHTTHYHFEGINDDSNLFESLQNQSPEDRAKGGITEALLIAEKILRDKKSSQEQQVTALKFLIHFVGDLHQPLHTGRIEDSGGNKVPIRWFGQKSNLHSVWDSGLIIKAHEQELNLEEAKGNSPELYAQHLLRNWSLHRAEFLADKDFLTWLNESLSLRISAYDPMIESGPEEYLNKNIDIVDSRVYAAGVRLGALLNSIFKSSQIPALHQKLRKNIESIVGSLLEIISLQPVRNEV